MMRKCHLNTCPVGVATQDPVLRAKFTGQPEHVINFFFFVAEEVRELMAAMGYRTFNEMIGQMQMLDQRKVIEHWKAKGLDFSKLFTKPIAPDSVGIYRSEAQDHKIHDILDRKLIAQSQAALDRGAPVRISAPIRNIDRTAGAMLSGEIAKRYGHTGLPDDTIQVSLKGTAGQSFGAFLAKGVTFELEGEGNDYVGKGLSGGRIVIRPAPDAGIVPEESIIVGNTVLYGAIAGEAYFRGIAGERFAVRNSGATVVVEGTGDHGCEYMTGGIVVVIGSTGRNFAAGMSGGIAYVLDEDGTFEKRCNMAMVELEPIAAEEEISDKVYGHANDLESHGRVDISADLTQLRRRAAAHPDHPPRPLHRIEARRRNPRRLEEILPDVPQGDAGRVPSRARRTEGARSRRGRETQARPGVTSMGKVTGFLEFERDDRDYLPVEERIRNYKEFVLPLPEKDIREQAARCMNCGVPYCHGTNTITSMPTGCPVNNQIPDWNDLVYSGNWEEAARNLHSTNNFPEVTGRVCPAPCEASCTLNIDDNPVTIKTIEQEIADRAIENGWVKPERYAAKTGKKVAVIGSGPAGMACAQQLARAGHDVHLYEKNAKAGGLMRYGIPDFKMEKRIVDIRVTQMEGEGVTFHYGVHVGVDLPVEKLLQDYDAVALTGGAEKARDLPIPGRELNGIHFAMDFLPQQNRRNSGEALLGLGAADPRQGQARRRHRRRRHRLRLHRHLDPPGRQVGDQFRDHAAAARAREQAADLAALAAEAAHLVEPRGRRDARLRRADDEVHRRERPGEEAALRARRRQVPADPRHRVRARRRSRAARHGLRASGARRHDQDARSRSRPARQRQGRPDRLRDLAAEGVRRRRHAPRPVAGGVGDPRRPPVRPRDRQVPDGSDRAAAVTRAARAVSSSAEKREEALAARLAAATAVLGAAGGDRPARRRIGRGDRARLGVRRGDRGLRRRLHDRDRLRGGGDHRIGADRRDGAARPCEIVAAPGRRRDRLAVHQHAGHRLRRRRVAGVAGADQLLRRGHRRGQRHHRAGERARGRPAGPAATAGACGSLDGSATGSEPGAITRRISRSR